jgi:ABC-type sulfate/molybdate transport systems ATPase subunit/ABC-type spermidine/putrescine transport system permease subunit II
VLAATLFPYVFISCRAIFVREAAGSLEAARMLGAGHRRVFLTVALPMARPAIVAEASLVGMEAMNDYGVVTAFGLGTLTPGIFRAWTEGFPGAAMRLAMVRMGMTLLFISLERWQRGKLRFAGGPSEAPLVRHRLGPLGIAFAWLVCGGPLLLGFIVPVVRMMRWAVQSHDRMDWAGHLAAAGNSIFLACGAAVLVTLGAIVLVAGGWVFPGKSLPSAQRIGILGYAFPSALVAVGVGAVVSGLSAFSGFGILALSASAFGLMLAYFVRFLAVGIQPVAAGFEAVSGSLHEAARTLGVKPVRALLRIDLPLVWPVLVAGATPADQRRRCVMFPSSLPEEKLLSLVGESGSGKTTLLRLLAGLERPDRGTISLDGRVLSSPAAVVPPEQRGIGLVFQHHALFPHLTVEKNFGFGIWRRSREEREGIIGQLLALVGLTGFGKRYPHELSGGERQRIALARALAPEPILLLLDEPFSSLDARLQQAVRDDTRAILKERGATALFVTHDTGDALSIADRIVVLKQGLLQQDGAPPEVYHAPANAYVASFFGTCNFLPMYSLPNPSGARILCHVGPPKPKEKPDSGTMSAA